MLGAPVPVTKKMARAGGPHQVIVIILCCLLLRLPLQCTALHESYNSRNQVYKVFQNHVIFVRLLAQFNFLQSPNCSIWSERQTAKLKRDLKFRRVRLDICDDNPEKSFNNPLHATLQLVWVWVEKGGENLDAQLQIHVGHYDLGEDEFAVQLILVWYFRMSCN